MRKRPGLRNVLFMAFGIFAVCSAHVSEAAAADADGSGTVDLKDAVTALQVCAGMKPSVNVSADVNGDGKIGLEEAAFVLRATAETYLSPFGAMSAQSLYGSIKEGNWWVSYQEAAEIGIKWSREAVPDFTPHDDQNMKNLTDIHEPMLKKAAEEGIPMNYVFNFHIAGSAKEDSRWTPKTELVQKYTDWIKYVVERYDGDGTNDMPGLVYPIKYWQIDNEPDLHPEAEASSYAELLKISYEAIKSADPDAEVLCGGIGLGSEGYNIGYYQTVFGTYQQRYFDIFDFHYYGNAKTAYRHIENDLAPLRSFFETKGWKDVRVWCTEMGTYSGQPKGMEFQSEIQQAADYVKRWIHGISVGLQVIFGACWLKEGYAVQSWDEYFDHTGLIYDGKDGDGNPDPHDRGDNVKKIAYHSFQIMTEKLEGLRYRQVTELGLNTYSYRFANPLTGKSVFAVWWDGCDEGTSMSATLSGITGNAVKITDAITDYSGNRTIRTVAVADGGTELDLEAYHPVFIEEE